LNGVGLGVLSTWHVAPDIESGRLVPIHLDDAEPKVLSISAVFPTNRQVLPKVRIFVNALKLSLVEKS